MGFDNILYNKNLVKRIFLSTFLNLDKKVSPLGSKYNTGSKSKFLVTERNLFQYILNNKTRPFIKNFNKHLCKDHCINFFLISFTFSEKMRECIRKI
jgi:hypothetical protein